MTAANDLAVRRALEFVTAEFIDENGGGPGLRLRKAREKRGEAEPEDLPALRIRDYTLCRADLLCDS